MVKVYQKYHHSNTTGVIASTSGNSILASSRFAITPALQSVHIWDIKKGILHSCLYEKGIDFNVTCIINAFVSISTNGSTSTPHALVKQQEKIVVGYADGSIRIWDISTCQVLLTLKGHSQAVTSLLLDPTGSKLISGSQDTDIIIWDLVSESGLFRLKGHKDQITCLKWIPTTLHLISSCKDSLVKIWDLSTQSCIETLVTNRGAIWSLEFLSSDDCNWLITGADDGIVRVYQVDLEILEKKLDTFETILDSDGNIQKALVLLGQLEKTSKERVSTIVISKDSRFLGIQSADSLLELYKIRSLEEKNKKLARRIKRKKEKGHSLENVDTALDVADCIPKFAQIRASFKIKSMDFQVFAHDSLKILCHLSNNTIQIHECVHGSKDHEHRLVSSIELPGHRSDIRSLCLSFDDEMYASGSSDLLKIWNTKTQECILSMSSGYILCISFLPGNRYIIAGTKSGELELYDLGSGSLLETIQAHQGPIWSLQIKPDKTGLITGSQDKQVKFWDFKLIQNQENNQKRITLAHTQTLQMTDDVLCIKLSPDGKLLAVSLLDSTVKVFYADTLKFYLSLYGHKLPVVSMDISSDSCMIATASSDKSIKLWGLDFGDCHKSILAHDDAVMSVSFIWGTHYLFSVSKDKLVKLWDMDKFEMIQKLSGHQGEVWALAVGKYGNVCITGSHDRSIRLWSKTEEQFVLEEAQEEELEELYEKMDLKSNQFDAPIGSGVEGAQPLPEHQVKSAGLKTIETLKAGERILEALSVWEEEVKSFEIYENLKSKDPQAAPPPRNPLVLAFGKPNITPDEFVFETIQKIKSSQLEEALFMLPFSHVILLLHNLYVWIEKGWNPRLSSRILYILLKTHLSQITSQKTLKSLLEKMNTTLKQRLVESKDRIGYNLAGLEYLKSELSSRHSFEFFGPSLLEDKKGIKRRIN